MRSNRGSSSVRYGMWRLDGSLASSARLRDLIEARLAGLDHEEKTALELMAIGEPLPLSVLESIVSVAAVERLEERSLLEAGTDGVEPELRLAHPLYGELVRDTLPTVRRARLSRALADAVEGAGEVSGADVLRVAVWRLDGGGGRPDFIANAARARPSGPTTTGWPSDWAGPVGNCGSGPMPHSCWARRSTSSVWPARRT